MCAIIPVLNWENQNSSGVNMFKGRGQVGLIKVFSFCGTLHCLPFCSSLSFFFSTASKVASVPFTLIHLISTTTSIMPSWVWQVKSAGKSVQPAGFHKNTDIWLQCIAKVSQVEVTQYIPAPMFCPTSYKDKASFDCRTCLFWSLLPTSSLYNMLCVIKGHYLLTLMLVEIF